MLSDTLRMLGDDPSERSWGNFPDDGDNAHGVGRRVKQTTDYAPKP